jgi:hypothetical protein
MNILIIKLILINHLTFLRLLDTNFELHGIYCCVGGDELLFDDDVCVVSHDETILATDDDHGRPKYLLHC